MLLFLKLLGESGGPGQPGDRGPRRRSGNKPPAKEQSQPVPGDSALGSVLAMALLRIRTTPWSGIALRPCEIIYGRPFQAAIETGDIYVDRDVKD